MSNWKKRGQAGWVGKKEAKSKGRRERNFSKEEIRDEIKQIEEGDDFRYKGGGKNKDPIARQRYWVDYYERATKEAEARKDNCRWTGFGTYYNRFVEAKRQLEKMIREKKGEKPEKEYCYFCNKCEEPCGREIKLPKETSDSEKI